ncbi:MAG: hypothetical protein Harvfovirus58_6 [Harvfovirus sp.]|uniref:Uncharacterized protein n=1 Tax=Harvfovirus sp. TaxID=2487768 RepID=A0A3G5A3E1_9VIRU|nr:MAG: hypothetical protein Harvfovirus58_6 [Harvfovirus sp.]
MENPKEQMLIRDKINMMINDEKVEKIDDALSEDEIQEEALETSCEQSNKVEKNGVENDFREKVLTFVRCDDLIRKKTKEIKELKEKREPCKEYILQYLVKKDSPFVNVKDGKLIKNKSAPKGSLTADIIKESISEGIKDKKLISDGDGIAAEIMEIMEKKRINNKTVKMNLKRTFVRPKAEVKQKK